MGSVWIRTGKREKVLKNRGPQGETRLTIDVVMLEVSIFG